MTECPQWRLRSSHYLNVPGTEYIHTEVSRDTGRQNRKTYAVPRLVDPGDPNDCNRDGDCIVFNLILDATKMPRSAIEFIGDPTPEMEPLNVEAEAISKTFEEKWNKPFTEFALAGEVGESYFANLTTAIERAIDKGGGRVAEPNQPVVSIDEFNALKAQLAELTNALSAKSERRV